MLLIPAIDLKDGKCVRLQQGDMHASTTFGEDPAAMARRWLDAGARRLHLVDLNGAFAGKPVNEAAVKAIVAEVDGAIAGTAGVDAVGRRDKVRHRATFGISLDEAYWRLGIGSALTAACIGCARQAGYAQLELEVVEDNARAIALYKKAGFVECGRNPLGLRPRTGGYQALVFMRLEL